MDIDDRKELLTRAEIMNRVYLQDISKLDGDINRLEKLLDREINHTSIATLDNVIPFHYGCFYSIFFLDFKLLLLFERNIVGDLWQIKESLMLHAWP